MRADTNVGTLCGLHLLLCCLLFGGLLLMCCRTSPLRLHPRPPAEAATPDPASDAHCRIHTVVAGETMDIIARVRDIKRAAAASSGSKQRQQAAAASSGSEQLQQQRWLGVHADWQLLAPARV